MDGVSRTYNVYRPRGISSPAPLVIMLHGGLGTANHAEATYGWDEEADAGHFVVAYPNGPIAWNVGGGCCGHAGAANVDDTGFITSVVAMLKREMSIDSRRVYVTGFSNGGMMAYTLACQTHGIFAAIGPVSGTQLGNCENPSPISIIHIHGTADPTVRYEGGAGSGTAQIDGPPIPSLIAAWRSIDSCSAPSVSTAGIVTTSLAQCAGSRAVELVSLAGIGHEWPGAPGATTALEATHVIWAFFASHPQAGAGG